MGGGRPARGWKTEAQGTYVLTAVGQRNALQLLGELQLDGAVAMESLGSLLLRVVRDIATGNSALRAPAIARRLIEIAVLKLPEEDRARWLEEWLADLDDLPGSFSKLSHGLGCLKAANRLAATRGLPDIQKAKLHRPKPPFSRRGSNAGKIQISVQFVLAAGIVALLFVFLSPMHDRSFRNARELPDGVLSGRLVNCKATPREEVCSRR